MVEGIRAGWCPLFNSIFLPKTTFLNSQGVLCKGYQPRPKNGQEFFCKEKFHAANGKTQACIEGALLFFPFKFGGAGWGGRIFFPIFLSFPICSHHVPFEFPLVSHHVLNMFPRCSPYHLTFIPYALANVVLLSPIQLGQRGGTPYTSKYKLLFWGVFIVSFFFLSDGPIKLARCKKEKN